MNDQQFKLQQEMLEMILNKLEEIRCGLIDIETAIENKNNDHPPGNGEGY